MKKLFLIAAILCFSLPLLSQKAKSKSNANTLDRKIPMLATSWESPPELTEFINHKNVPAIKILSSSGKVVAKDILFTDGTIEFDIDPYDEPFAGIYFRMADDNETEYLYLRVARAGNPVAMDAIQYAAYAKGVNMWDLLDHYQGPASFSRNEWNHIKMVISGKQMVVYVNDMTRPALEIPSLEGNTSQGKLAFNGKCVIANIVLKPGQVEGLSSREGFDPTHHDPRYIRAFQVNEPQPLPKGRELYDGDFPKLAVSWNTINAERRGLINLTRLFGASQSRRYVWLRTKLISKNEQTRRISLGFSDEVWVYLNRQLVFVDKNIYTSPQMRKEPDGRISVENAKFDITLKPGENDLLIGVANDFFGWGIMAHLDKMDGIQVSTNFPPPVLPPNDLGPYTGTFKSTDGEMQLVFTSENSVLMGQAPGQPAVALEYFEKDKFRYDQEGIVLEFYPEEKKMVLRQGNFSRTFAKEQ